VIRHRVAIGVKRRDDLHRPQGDPARQKPIQFHIPIRPARDQAGPGGHRGFRPAMHGKATRNGVRKQCFIAEVAADVVASVQIAADHHRQAVKIRIQRINQPCKLQTAPSGGGHAFQMGRNHHQRAAFGLNHRANCHPLAQTGLIFTVGKPVPRPGKRQQEWPLQPGTGHQGIAVKAFSFCKSVQNSRSVSEPRPSSRNSTPKA